MHLRRNNVWYDRLRAVLRSNGMAGLCEAAHGLPQWINLKLSSKPKLKDEILNHFRFKLSLTRKLIFFS